MKEALDKDINVELPDPSTIRPQRITPELLRRVLAILGVILVLTLIVNAALLLIPVGVQPVNAQAALDQLRARQAQLRTDLISQTTAWQALQTTGQIDCNPMFDPAPESLNTGAALSALNLDPATQYELSQAAQQLAAAADQLTLVANNRLVACNTDTPPASVEENLTRLAQATTALDQAGPFLAQAEAQLQAVATPVLPTAEPVLPSPTVPVTAPVEAKPTTAPVVETPIEAAPTDGAAPFATVTPVPAIDYATYIRELRQRIDFVIGTRGEVTLLAQYWQDIRTAGQSQGCRQVLDPAAPELADYTALRPQDAEADPQLNNIVTSMNIGLAMARDSMSSFLQGCATNNFGPVLAVGEQQIQQAISIFNQVAALLDQLQVEVVP
jgi:hypothetical protein